MSRTYKDHTEKMPLSRTARRRLRLRIERKEKLALYRAARYWPNSACGIAHHD